MNMIEYKNLQLGQKVKIISKGVDFEKIARVIGITLYGGMIQIQLINPSDRFKNGDSIRWIGHGALQLMT